MRRWRATQHTRDPQGRCEATLETCADAQPTLDSAGPARGRWRATRHTRLARREGKIVLENAMQTVRVWLRSEASLAFAARTLESTHASNALERTLARWGVGAGLLARAGEEAHGGARGRWSEEEAWAYAGAREAWARAEHPIERWGGVGQGEGHEGREGLRDGECEEGAITLPAYGAHPWSLGRAIPATSRRFRRTPVRLRALSRWFGRFARVQRYERGQGPHGTAIQCVERGTPEAGGLGALRLWVATRRVQGLEQRLYQYDSARHTLHDTGAPSAPFIAVSEGCLEAGPGRGEIAGTVVVSARMRRITAVYDHVALALAHQGAGACLAAATAAGAAEEIGVCGQVRVPAEQWEQATRRGPPDEVAVSAFMFAMANIEAR